jgi:NADPH:quinone reductase-like Zn-dependent oxidoreductase/predicted TPR repeat methyltransferase
LAQDNVVDVDKLVADRLLPATAKPWFRDLLIALECSGLASENNKVWRIDTSVALPDPDAILRNFAADHQSSSAELLLAASSWESVKALVDGDFETFARPFALSVLDGFEIGGNQACASAALLAHLLELSTKAWPKDRAIRILQIGYGPLSGRAVALLTSTAARLTIFDPERRRLERARLAYETRGNIEFVEKVSDLPERTFDLVVAAETLYCLDGAPPLWPGVRQAMAPGAVFAAVEPSPSLFRDLVFGLNAAKSNQRGQAGSLAGTAHSESAWADTMRAIGLSDINVDRVLTRAGGAQLLSGALTAERRHWSGTGSALIVGDDNARGTELTSAFATLLASSGLHVSIILDRDLADESLNDGADMVVFFAGVSDDHSTAVKALTDKCLRLKRSVERLGGRKATVWIVTSGATSADGRVQGNIATGIWAFSRTLANEFQGLDVRRVDVSNELMPDTVAERLRDLVLSKTDETEIILTPSGTRVVRFETPTFRERSQGLPAEAACLERGEGSGIDRIHWVAAKRRPPDAGEVEIAVDAIGLNFRDVMWGLGLLPEEILENGFAGPTLGLECAGRISRVGAGVKNFKIDEPVIAFAKAAFATHVTVPAIVVASTPAKIAAETAATIPVAFLTAYYGLVVCARLKRREWVLIHGGAGGVGLAALQIALWRGARVIATAGSAEKRALLKSLGAELVFDSRSGAFVEQVRKATGTGVGVVLNSLSGEAMERSIGLLRPFGRFVELGKRDYVANTHVGLRPFQKNLSYFGVDLDQLLLNDPATAKKLFHSVLSLFANGTFSPLPHRTFEAHEIVDAFRLMQQSGHIGKLIVKPPQAKDIRVNSSRAFTVSPDKTHMITGGLGGFGLETARWLADKGARHLLLVGRRGAVDDNARTALADLAAKGIDVRVEAMDIAEKPAVQRLFAKFGTELPPLAGVVHAAMVLEDAVIANLDAEKLERVLRPKVAGAEYLDQLSRSSELDYFVLFSSATTAIGNPGQASYVAANGYLEGLARRRRRAGLPALAIAWGAIEDVGILTRARAARESLAARAGVKGMKAREALDLMGRALTTSGVSEDDAVIVIAPIDWAAARERLPVLRSPTYANLARNGHAEAGESAKVDLVELLAHGANDSIRKTVSGMIVEEISLALGLEERLGLKAPLSASASGFTVVELAEHVIGLASGSMSQDDAVTKEMVGRHLGDVDPEALGPAAELVRQKSMNLKDILQ